MTDDPLAGLLGEIERIADPVERAKRYTALMDDLGAATAKASEARQGDLAELKNVRGMTQAEIAKLLGVSPPRVNQMLKSVPAPPPERLFWGAGELTIAVGRKLEAPKDASGKQGPVVAEEDMQAFCALTASLAPMGLTTRAETVPQGGYIRLNRDNLVVICGPRLSPLIGQVLESDPNLGFAKDEAGWHLIDRKTGKAYRSPLDDDVPEDYGYLGRLPRIDGKGNFLYIAGIHAAGAPGVVHYLDQNLASVYNEVKTKRFSTLIHCEFDPNTREIIKSEQVTPFYRHEGN